MTGFPPDTLTFLRDLADDPTPAFFDAHRDRYRDHWVAPTRAFVEAVAPRLAQLAPAMVADPRVHGSVLSPRQDVRFADRPPYRDHVGLLFWEGDRAAATSVLFLRLFPDHVTLGAGARRFDRRQLRAHRERVLDPTAGADLLDAVAEVERAGWSLHGRTLRRGPRDVASDDPDRQRLLCHTALWVEDALPLPGVLGSRRFVDWCVRRWAQQLPVHRWLVDHLP